MKLKRRDRHDLGSLLRLIASWWLGMILTAAFTGLWWFAVKTAGLLTITSLCTVAVIYLRRDPR